MTTYVTAGENGIEVTVGMLTRPQLDAVAAAEAPSASNEFVTVSALGDLAAEAGDTSLEVATARDAVPNDTEPDSLYDTINLIGQKVHRVDAYASTGIQGAIDAAEVSGGVVEFAPYKSTYTTGAMLTATAPLRIAGQGATLTATAAVTAMLQASAALRVDDLTIDGGEATPWGVNVIAGGALNLRNSIVRDLKQQSGGVAAVGVRVVEGTGDITIEGCEFDNVLDHASGSPAYTARHIMIHNAGGTAGTFGAIRILNNHFKDIGTNTASYDSDSIHLSLLDEMLVSVLIANNYFRNAAKRFIKLAGGGAQIINNKFRSLWDEAEGDTELYAAIDIQYTGRTIITGNDIALTDAQYGVNIGTAAAVKANIIIADNYIAGNAHDRGGAAIGSQANDLDRLVIADNVLIGFTYGISFNNATGSNGVTIHDNLITNSYYDGIKIDSGSTGMEGASIHDNRFRGVGRHGINLEEGTDHHLHDNYATASGGVGTTLTGTLINIASPATYTGWNNVGPGSNTAASIGNAPAGDMPTTVGGHKVLLSFYLDNLSASASVEMSKSGGAVKDYVMPYAGSVLSITVYSNEARTAGTLEARLRLDGSTDSTTAAFLNGTDTTYAQFTRNKDTRTFAAGTRVGARAITTSWGPTTADITVEVLVEF